MNPYRIVIQKIYPGKLPVPRSTLKAWAILPLQDLPSASLTLRLVSNDDMQHLNHTYRHQPTPTNILAFPSQLPPDLPQKHPFLGDLVIAPDVLHAEYTHFCNRLDAHWAHILIHGILHLRGYTHETPADTARMQAQEAHWLAQLQFPHPHLMEHSHLA